MYNEDNQWTRDGRHSDMDLKDCSIPLASVAPAHTLQHRFLGTFLLIVPYMIPRSPIPIHDHQSMLHLHINETYYFSIYKVTFCRKISI